MTKSEEYSMFEKDLDGSPARLDVRRLRKLLDYCLSNAQQLSSSAELLFNKKMYSASVLLSVLSIEELGKRRILHSYIWKADNISERRKLWRSFRSHKQKIYWALRPLLYSGLNTEQNREVKYISVWFKEHQELESDAAVVDQIKQLATYTNVIEGKILNPKMLAKRRLAYKALSLSKELLTEHSKMEQTDAIIEYYKRNREKTKKGETLVHFLEKEGKTY